jgi:polyhydroxyalkanoate synthesis regulator phasin
VASSLDARRVTQIVVGEQDRSSIDRTRARAFDRTAAFAVIALAVSMVSLMVGFSRASTAALDEVRFEVADVANAAASATDLQEVERRLAAIESSAGDAAASIAAIQTLTADMAVASKVDAALAELRSSIDSLRREVDALCDQINVTTTPVYLPPGC